MSTVGKTVLLFPSSYFSAKRVDEDLKEEYDAAFDTGEFDIILFSYDNWFREGKLSLDRMPEAPAKAVYRGWMMKTEQYAEFYARLAEKNIKLITSPEEYERFHIFPNIYPQLKDDTAGIMVFPDGRVDLEKVKKRFGRFMVKDFVKSVKGTDFPKYFDSTVTEEEFSRAMELFYKYRGDLLTGGICVKEYLDLKRYNGITNEFRVFYIRGRACTICRNSNQEEFVPGPPSSIVERYKGLGSPFYTIDYAEIVDGCWKIIEAGDGQVSGLSPGQSPKVFFRLLAVMTKEKR